VDGHLVICLRNKAWKPECVGSFNMDWRILVFYPEPEARDKICQMFEFDMVKLVILLLTGPFIRFDCSRYQCSSERVFF